MEVVSYVDIQADGSRCHCGYPTSDNSKLGHGFDVQMSKILVYDMRNCLLHTWSIIMDFIDLINDSVFLVRFQKVEDCRSPDFFLDFDINSW